MDPSVCRMESRANQPSLLMRRQRFEALFSCQDQECCCSTTTSMSSSENLSTAFKKYSILIFLIVGMFVMGVCFRQLSNKNPVIIPHSGWCRHSTLYMATRNNELKQLNATREMKKMERQLRRATASTTTTTLTTTTTPIRTMPTTTIATTSTTTTTSPRPLQTRRQMTPQSSLMTVSTARTNVQDLDDGDDVYPYRDDAEYRNWPNSVKGCHKRDIQNSIVLLDPQFQSLMSTTTTTTATATLASANIIEDNDVSHAEYDTDDLTNKTEASSTTPNTLFNT